MRSPLRRPGRRVQPRRLSAGTAGTACAVLAVLAAALWSLVATAASPVVTHSGVLAVDGGWVTVDRVISAAAARHAMPGMGTDDDPVAEGERRVSLDVTLRAGEREVLEYGTHRFALVLPGLPPRPVHKAVLPGTAVPGGTQISGTLVFDVPVSARSATLVVDGEVGTVVALPPEGGGGDGGRHGSGGPGHDRHEPVP